MIATRTAYPLLLTPGKKSTTGIDPGLVSSIVSSSAEKLSARTLPPSVPSPIEDLLECEAEPGAGEGARLDAGVETVEVTEMMDVVERCVAR